jgi:hypothetical protein
MSGFFKTEANKLWPMGFVFFLMKLYVNTATFICLCIGYGCFHVTAAKLNNWNKDSKVFCNIQILPSSSFKKTFALGPGGSQL